MAELADIFKSLHKTKSTQNKSVTAVNDQAMILKNLNKRFDDLNEKFKQLSDENIKLNNRVTCLEDKVKILDQSNLTTQNLLNFDFINGILDRQSRENNTLLFNFQKRSPNLPLEKLNMIV